MKKTVLAFLLLFICSSTLFAQKEGYVWTFGTRAGIDFNGSVPVPIKTKADQAAMTATVCDANGQLLFYTSNGLTGVNVYNRNHQVMGNGTNILPIVWFNVPTARYGAEGTQGHLITPMPGSPGKYYVFNIESMVGSNSGHQYQLDGMRLFYTVVDMSLNGGLGGVVAGQKGIQFDSGLSNMMTATWTSDCNIWLILKNKNLNQYKSYKITSSGISTTPVLSNTGIYSPCCGPITMGAGPTANWLGTMQFSPDYRKMAVTTGTAASNSFPVNRGVEIFDFDKVTGMLSNPLQLDLGAPPSIPSYGTGYGEAYDACFSPDGSKIYLTTQGEGVYQFDLSQGTQAAIVATKTKVYVPVTTAATGSLDYTGDIKLGPDGKIYFGSRRTVNMNVTGIYRYYLHRIEQPNLAGTACQVVRDAFQLMDSTSVRFGLTNDVLGKPGNDTFKNAKNMIACIKDSLVLQASSQGFNFIWDNGVTTGNRTIYQAGKYVVKYETSGSCSLNNYNIDTFIITKWAPVVDVKGACRLDKGMTWTVMQAGDTATATYTWRDASNAIIKTRQSKSGDTLLNASPGQYSLRIQRGPCDSIIQVTVPVSYAPVIAATVTGSCNNGQTGKVAVTLPTGDTSTITYQWMDASGNTIATHQVKNGDVIDNLRPGKHTLLVKGKCDTTVEFNIPVLPAPNVSVNATGSCATERTGKAWVTSIAGTTNSTTYEWRDAGNAVLKTGQGTNGEKLDNVAPGTYSVHIQDACDTIVTFIVPEYPAPRAMFDADTNVCIMHPVVFNNTTQDVLTWSWNFGNGSASVEKNPTYVYSRVGDYLVTLDVRNENCPDKISKTIHVRDFELGLTADKSIVRIKDSVTLQSASASQYVVLAWLPSELFADQAAYSQTISVDKKVPYFVVGRSDYGCIDTATIIINLKSKMEIPTAFSPNGDGKNDYFRPLFLFGNMSVDFFRIYDRWGKLVWIGVANEALKGWDGTYDGVQAQVGVYYYMIKATDIDGEVIEGKGDVTLLR